MWSYFDKRAKRLGILDTKLAQAAAVFLTLFVARLIPQLLRLDAWVFALLAVLCAIRPLIVFYGKGADSA